MWSWSLAATSAKATGRSLSGSVASSRVNRPRCSSSTQSVPLKCSRTLRRCSPGRVGRPGRGARRRRTRGQVEEELAPERPEGPFDAHAVLEEAIEDEVADLVVIGGPGRTSSGVLRKVAEHSHRAAYSP